MKFFRTMTIILFTVIIAVPIIFFNFSRDAISDIDNRKLADNPFESDGDLTKNIESYINDRIGFRDKMILAYTIINDRLFNKMVHPIYTYGKDGYVFGSGITTSDNFGDFHIAYADMVKEMQDYCEARGIPFLFVFNPAKPAVLSDKLMDGINYNRVWVDKFFSELDARGVNYVDNTITLREATKNGQAVFNQKYDANHWNALGAYCGTRAALEKLQNDCPGIHIGELSEFDVSFQKKTSLLVSEFPINEDVPVIHTKCDYEKITSAYSSLRLDSQYHTFGYYVVPQRQQQGAPRALVFQGSYMNSYGTDFFTNAFGEYIFVHDYQNVIDLPYYFNVFQPDCVIFEAAEYTFSNDFFNYKKMKNIDYAPAITSLSPDDYSTVSYDFNVTVNDALTTIEWNTDIDSRYVWIKIGDTVYDAEKCEKGYTLTLRTEDYESAAGNIAVYASRY